MDPILGGLITGGASLLSGLFSSTTSAANTQAQIANQQSMLQQSEAYNTQMSSTAYQRASADMKAAGLNPAMMFSSGSAASSPSLATPSAPVPQTTSPLANLGDAAGKAVSTAVQMKTLDKMTDEIANLKAERARTEAATLTEREKPALVQEEAAATGKLTQLRGTEVQQRQHLMSTYQLSGEEADAILRLPHAVRDPLLQGSYGVRKAADIVAPIVSNVRGIVGKRSTIQRDRSDGESSFEQRWSQ